MTRTRFIGTTIVALLATALLVASPLVAVARILMPLPPIQLGADFRGEANIINTNNNGPQLLLSVDFGVRSDAQIDMKTEFLGTMPRPLMPQGFASSSLMFDFPFPPPFATSTLPFKPLLQFASSTFPLPPFFGTTTPPIASGTPPFTANVLLENAVIGVVQNINTSDMSLVLVRDVFGSVATTSVNIQLTSTTTIELLGATTTFASIKTEDRIHAIGTYNADGSVFTAIKVIILRPLPIADIGQQFWDWLTFRFGFW